MRASRQANNRHRLKARSRRRRICSPRLESLEQRTLLAADLTLVGNGLRNAFENLQVAVNDQVWSASAPLVGDQLKEQESPGQVLTDLANKVGGNFSGADTIAEINAAVGSAFGGTVTAVVGQDGDDVIKFDATISTTLSGEVDFDLGLPGLDFVLDGTVNAEVTATANITFGVDESLGFFFDTFQNPELTLQLNVTPAETADGSVGFVEFAATNNNSSFSPSYFVDIVAGGDMLTNFSSVDLQTGVNGTADISYDLEARLPGADLSPKIVTQLNLDWEFDGASPEASVFGDRPTVAFDDIALDLGSFFTGLVGPVITQVQGVLKPLEPMVDALTTEIELLETLKLKDALGLDGIAFVDLVGGPALKNFVSATETILELDVPDAGNIMIPLGEFTTADPRMEEPNGLEFEATFEVEDTLNTARQQGGEKVSKFFKSSIDDIDGQGVRFPLLEEPLQAFKLLIGQEANLFTYTSPRMEAGWNASGRVPIPGLPGIFVELGGSISFGGQLTFGYDTVGIKNVLDGNGLASAFDGFFVADTANPDGSGEDIGEAFIKGEVTLAVVADGGVIEISGGGALTATAEFNLRDLNNDGKVRADEIVAAARGGLTCMFDTEGRLEASLFATASAGVTVFGRTIGVSGSVRYTFDPLLVLNSTCEEPVFPPPVLATQEGDVLKLNIGPRAEMRERGNTSDGDEHYEIFQGDDDGTVIVSAFGFEQRFRNVRRIEGDAGEGRDSVIVKEGVIIPDIEIHGGPGDDDLLSGGGRFRFTPGGPPMLVFHGDAGDDDLTAFRGPAVLLGGDGDDTLTGGGSVDTLMGGRGDDLLYGNSSDDELDGGDGDDTLQGGEGNDTLRGGDGQDDLLGEDGDDELLAGEGSDSLQGGEGNDTLNGGESDDTLFGDAGDDSLVGGRHDDILLGGGGNDTLDGGLGNDSLDGSAGDDIVNGGGDNDLLISMPTDEEPDTGSDVLNGGLGRDTLDGTLSTEPITLLGGQQNDLLLGSAFDDTLQGDLGEDTLFGGAGADDLQGGTGADTFIDADADSDANIDGSLSVDVRISDLPDPVQVGQAVTYFVRATNSGEDFIHSLSLSAQLVSGPADFTDRMEELGDPLQLNYPFEAPLPRVFRPGDSENFTVAAPSTGVGLITVDAIAASPLLPGGQVTDRAETTVFQTVAGGGANVSFSGGSLEAILTGAAGISLVARSHPVGRAADGSCIREPVIAVGQDLLMKSGSPIMCRPFDGAPELAFDPAHLAADVSSVLVEGGDGPNQISVAEFENASIEINGGDGNDTIHGTVGADLIRGGAGSDLIIGQTGNDTIMGGEGNDEIRASSGVGASDSNQIMGGPGDDFLEGGDGPDFLDGGEGNDVLRGSLNVSDGNDTLIGGTGNDRLGGSRGNDFLEGGEGNDTLGGGMGDDTMLGGIGNDNITDGSGADLMQGGEGNDVLNVASADEIPDTVEGGLGNDILMGSINSPLATQIMGGPGDDDLSGGGTLQGNEGNDTLEGSGVLDGGVGSDTLIARGGVDVTLIGGEGDDLLRITLVARLAPTGNVTMMGGPGNDSLLTYGGADDLDGGDGDDSLLVEQGPIRLMETGFARDGEVGDLSNIESIELISNNVDATGYLGDLIITGTFLVDTLIGGSGNDIIDALAGSDEVHGGPGNDIIFGRQQLDTIFGGAGDDIIEGGFDSDSIMGGEGNDLIDGGDEFEDNNICFNVCADFVDGGEGDDTIRGSRSDDTLIGGPGDDLLSGDGDNDSLIGGEGNDLISGGLGDDLLDGGAGDDELDGGDGQDELIGGSGNDALFGGRDELGGGLNIDQLDGGAGDDTLAGGTHNDNIMGGSGRDLLVARVRNEVSAADGDVILTNSTLSIPLDALNRNPVVWVDSQDQFSGIEAAQIIGSDLDNVIDASTFGGELFLDGGAGNDTLTGGTGDNDLLGGEDHDQLNVIPRAGQTYLLRDGGGIDRLNFEDSTIGIDLDLDALGDEQTQSNGSTLTLFGQFEEFIGSDQSDSVFIDPKPVARFLDGRNPSTSPGDRLTVNDFSTLFDVGTTNVQVLSFLPVNHINFEFVETESGGSLDGPTTAVRLDQDGNLIVEDITSGGNDENVTVSFDADTDEIVVTSMGHSLIVDTPNGISVNANEVRVPTSDVALQHVVLDLLAGNDVGQVHSLPDGFTVDLFGDDGNDELDASMLTGPATLNGGSGTNLLLGGSGDNIYVVGRGNDELDDVGGRDKIDASRSSNPVTIDLDFLGETQSLGGGNTITLLNGPYEDFMGSDHDDVITVGALADSGRDIRGSFNETSDPGDTLRVSANGEQTPDIGSDEFTVPGLMPVSFAEFETVAVVDVATTFTLPAGGGDVTLALDGDDVVLLRDGAEIFREASSIASPLTIDGNTDDQTLIVDLTNGNPIPKLGLVFNGGGPGDFDTLEIVGGTAATTTHSFANASSGDVMIDSRLITYSGLEPIIDGVVATNRVFEFADTDDVITLGENGDLNDNVLRISSVASSETVDFVSQTGSLTVSFGGGDDTLMVDVAGNLVLDGGAGDDLVKLGAAVSSLSVTAGGDAAGVDTIDASDPQAQTLTFDRLGTLSNADSTGELTVITSEDDTVAFAGDWVLTGTQVVDGVFQRILESEAAKVLLSGPRDWHNPLAGEDVNSDGQVLPFDVLFVINELNDPQFSDSTGTFVEAAQVDVSQFLFYDSDGNGLITPFDALRIINFINAGGGGEGEGARSVPVLDLQESPSAALEAAAKQSISEAGKLAAPEVPVKLQRSAVSVAVQAEIEDEEFEQLLDELATDVLSAGLE